MLQIIASYLRMPKPMVVFGVLFVAYAIFPLLKTIRDGYLSGMLSEVSRFKNHTIRLVLFLVLLLFAVYFIDLPIAKLCKAWYNVDVYTIFDFINSMGEGWFVVGLLVTLSLISDSLNKPKFAIILKISYVAAIYAGLFNAVLKFLFNRQRPSIGLEPFNFFYFFVSGDRRLIDLTYAYNSMPSGHTITIFAAIVPLVMYTRSLWCRLTLLMFALMIGVARIYTMNHWFSDVYVSIVLGLVIGMGVYRANFSRIET